MQLRFVPRSSSSLSVPCQCGAASVTVIWPAYEPFVLADQSALHKALNRAQLNVTNVMSAILILLGSNLPGHWGSPAETLRRAVKELDKRGIVTVRASALYETRPVGGPRQPNYMNAVILAKAKVAPSMLLRILKQLEALAGRRPGIGARPRPLDLDILDFGGRILGWPAATARQGLILPHPELHRRAFALIPLLDVAPAWHHPALKVPAGRLLGRVRLRQGAPGVRRILDSGWFLCDQAFA